MGYHLAERGVPFIIMDGSERVGDAWRNRWDSLRLFTPAEHSSLPGLPFPGPTTAFPTKDEVADYMETYASHFELPVRLNTKVRSLSKSNGYFALETDAGRFEADNVVIATGPCGTPKIPRFASALDPSIVQVHSMDYRNPDQLPPGEVLVVGAGNSGSEIALELARSRRTWLSGRSTGRIPAFVTGGAGSLRSRIYWRLVSQWLSADSQAGQGIREKMLSGHGDPLIQKDPRDLLRAGVERLPRTEGVRGGLPVVPGGQVVDVRAVVWATGFAPDFSWIQIPSLSGEHGYPNHYRGAAHGHPGLYFIGLRFQYSLASSLIGGVGADASYIAGLIEPSADSSPHRPEDLSGTRVIKKKQRDTRAVVQV